MPTLPPGLTEWLPSGFFTALLGLTWYEVKASGARVNQRIDELRDDMKEMRPLPPAGRSSHPWAPPAPPRA
ncbi:MAG: hypothetical protein F4X84_05800 [Synechococcus sp. SB0662_bin_45]|uniref:Uncharacterized protein n=1 Tax=Synechococcus sp. SB0676_bin_10 TaxID=2604869 RepID=A0A6B1FA97_9SYNE|nr:hypothetical protein [Cyanobacteria bacterium MAG IRC3_bin_20]MDE0648359.1 hypothetical protein [Cyanobacteria bacterium MAG IRC4_bin_6]MXW12574.1 hypothetical protein [Synechococcus sp. SB0668_bin_13]MXY19004.1 hypothetical protein [Synechococcus sp. SB0664_bin_36]MYE21861.1 hypothetical protein [Synechococcus sp. SB0662_bin_45]MYG38154.1 hypothetical protein [Synechococcus sp. SB0676_bin_10]MYG63198.1 hypothetical protein [Synechococcus sp. SB0675_bin_7]MYK06976.1 hypothetical protein [